MIQALLNHMYPSSNPESGLWDAKRQRPQQNSISGSAIAGKVMSQKNPRSNAGSGVSVPLWKGQKIVLSICLF